MTIDPKCPTQSLIFQINLEGDTVPVASSLGHIRGCDSSTAGFIRGSTKQVEKKGREAKGKPLPFDASAAPVKRSLPNTSVQSSKGRFRVVVWNFARSVRLKRRKIRNSLGPLSRTRSCAAKQQICSWQGAVGVTIACCTGTSDDSAFQVGNRTAQNHNRRGLRVPESNSPFHQGRSHWGTVVRTSTFD